MLNFDDLDLVKLKVKEAETNKKLDEEKLKFYNSRYNKTNLSDYILVNKKPKKPKNKKDE